MQLPVRERHAVFRALPGETDQMLRADVGREDGRTDQEPASAAAREEVVLGVLALGHDGPDADGGVCNEIERDYAPVKSRKIDRCAGHEPPLVSTWCARRPPPANGDEI